MSKNRANDVNQQNKIIKYYVSRELEDIKELLEENNHEIFSYMIASLIDTVVLGLLAKFFGSNTNLGYIVMSVFGIALFLFLVWLINKYKKFSKRQDLITGRIRYSKKKNYMQLIIAKFDNIAYPAMLICEEYKSEYFMCENKSLKTFYYLEVVHYAIKASHISYEIIHKHHLYIKDRDMNYIAFYRVENFVNFLFDINCFIQEQFENCSHNLSLKQDIEELNNNVLNFKEIMENISKQEIDDLA